MLKILRIHKPADNKRIYNSADIDVQLPDGSMRTWSRIEGPDIAVIVAVDNQKNVYLKREFRLSQEKEILELPSGRIDAGESPEVCARRELQEEIGLTAASWHLLGRVSLWNHATVQANIYLARDVTLGANNPDEGEVLTVEPVPLTQALAILEREGSNAQTLLGLRLALEYLNK